MHVTLNTTKGVFVSCSSFKKILILSYANNNNNNMICIFYNLIFILMLNFSSVTADNYKSGSMVAGQTFTIGRFHASPCEFGPQNLPVFSSYGLVAESLNLANHTFHGIYCHFLFGIMQWYNYLL